MSPVAHPVGAGVPDGPFSVLRLRVAPASCICLRWPYFFQQRKKYGKERRQKPTVFGFPFRPIVTAVQKGSAPNRLHSYPRCRSCVRRVHQRRLYRRPHVSRHVSGRAPRRGRRPRRPVFRSPIAGCTRVLHVCLRRPYFFQQRKKYGKERRQKPTVFGFPLSDSNHGTKRFRIESLVPPSPLPLPRTARRRAGLLSCSGTVASISAVSRIPAQLDRRTP